MKSRLFFYALLLSIVGLIGWMGYLLYGSYTDYNRTKQNEAAVTLGQKIGVSAEAASSELRQSAVYFGSRGSSRKALQESREKADAAIQSMLSEAGKNSEEKVIRQIQADLIGIRSGIDAISGEYSVIVGMPFYQNIDDSLLKISQKLYKAPGHQNAYMKMHAALLGIISAISNERAFLLYTLLSKKPIDDTSMLFWESLTSQDFAPKLYISEDQAFSEKIGKILLDDKAMLKINALRASVFSHAFDAKYTSKSEDVFSVYGGLLKKSETARRLIVEKMQERLLGANESVKKSMIQYAAALLILLAVLLVLLRVSSGASKEKRVLEHTLREMVSHLDEERQKELNRIIKRGDTVATYRFLAQTTQDAHEARREAIQAEKAKDLFLANMSHEIRTPLNGILGFTQLLEGTNLDEEQQEFLDVIGISSNNLLKIVNNILDLSKIKADKMELEEVSFDAIALLQDAVEPHVVIAADKKIEYTTFIDPALPSLLGDPVKLSQIMTNLIGNAMKFTDYEGSVAVTVEKLDMQEEEIAVRFAVKDDGIGVSEEKKAHIFQAFSQADISTTRQFGGTGLGLTITSSLIDRMGGKLELKSEIGKGSEFSFVLHFRKDSNTQSHSPQHQGLSIGYYKPKETKDEMMEANLQCYVKATGADFHSFSDIDTENLSEYDAIVLNYSFPESREHLETVVAQSKHVIALIHISYTEDAKALQDKVSAIVYKPLNIKKIAKAFEVIGAGRQSAMTVRDGESIEDNERVEHFSGMHILLAEDNRINQKLIVEVVKNFGVEVTLANNGQEALSFRQAQEYDLVFMDIQMPVLSGIEATEAINQWEKEERKTHVPIIALTANALRGDREKYLAAGMDGYLSKPIDIGQLKKVFSQYFVAPEQDAARKKKQAEAGICQSEYGENNISSREQREEEVMPRAGIQKQPDEENIGSRREMVTTVIPAFGIEGLVGRIHQRTLGKQGYEMVPYDTLEEFLRCLEEEPYRNVLVHTSALSEDLCMALEALSEMETQVFVLGRKTDEPCGSAVYYGVMGELREYL